MRYGLKLNIEKMVDEILDHLPSYVWESKTTTFLDPAMAGGWFIKGIIRRLRAYGHSDRNIAKRVFGYENNILELNAVKTWLRRENLLHGHFTAMPYEKLLKGTKMKFDVVIGNPPYHIPHIRGSSNKLWDKFVIQALNIMVKNGGLIAFVTPSSWMAPNTMFKIITAKKLLWVKSDVSKYFPRIGSTFSAWIVKNEKGNNSAIVDDVKIEWSKIGLIPKDHSLIAINIINKVLGNEKKFDNFFDHSHDSRREHINKKKSKKYCYPIYHTNVQTLWSSKPHRTTGMKKVIATNSGYWKPFYDNKMGVSQCICVFPVNTKKEGAHLVNVLTSKLYKFVLANTKYSGFFLKTVLEKLPAVDLSRSWTDRQLYTHFGLTKKEIIYVEKNGVRI